MRHPALTTLLAIICIITTYSHASAQIIFNRKGTDLDTAAYFHVHKGHYVTLQGGGGLQTISHRPTASFAKLREGIGYHLKFGYRWYITTNWGIGGAIQYQLYGSTTKLNGLDYLASTDRTAYDYTSHPITPVVNYSNYMEKTQSMMVSIPVMLYWHTNITNFWKIGAGAGAMYNQSLWANYKDKKGTLQPQKYFEDINLLYYSEEGDHGTPILSGFNNKYHFGSTISATAEIEIMFSINPRLDLFGSVYVSHGITELKTNGTTPIYDPNWWDPDTEAWGQDPQYAGVLNSYSTAHARIRSAGLMFGIRYRIGHQAKLEFKRIEQARHIQKTQAFVIERQTTNHNRKEQETADNDSKKRDKRQDSDPQDQVKILDEQEIRQQYAERQRQKQIKDSLNREWEKENLRQQQQQEIQQTEQQRTADVSKMGSLINALNSTSTGAFNEPVPQLNHKQKDNLNELAQLLISNPDIHIDIIGHTCDLGTVEENKMIGLRRAESIKTELANRGVPRKQMHTSTKWWTEPLVPNTSEANRKKNRRIEIKIRQPQNQ